MNTHDVRFAWLKVQSETETGNEIHMEISRRIGIILDGIAVYANFYDPSVILFLSNSFIT